MSVATPKEYRILIIEDVPADVVLINHALRKAGLHFRTKRVHAEEQFLHELDHHPPDVILSDHGVPGFDSFRALEMAKSKLPRVPFLVVSGDTSEAAAREARERGATEYVPKTKLERLGGAVHRALHHRREQTRADSLDDQLQENRQHSRNLEERIKQLEAERKELEDFATRIASDCRAPINQIDSLCQRLDKTARDKIDQKSLSYLAAISQSARLVARLNDDLLTFSRIGQARLYPLRFSLRETVEETIRDLWREAQGRQVEWEIGPLPQVSADPALMLLVMTHLIANALQFTRPREHARIEIGSRREDDKTIVYVRDNGIGLPEGLHKEVFRVFKRAHVARELEGAGIGLAVVRRIIDRHGGSVWAEGKPERGATFCFTLPDSPETDRKTQA